MSEPERYRALSLWQPWASLWLSEAKVHETRGQATNVRGVVLVHAALKSVEVDDDLAAQLARHGIAGILPRGALIGAVILNGCFRIAVGGGRDGLPHGALHDQRAAHEDDVICGDWHEGRWAWRRAAVFVRFTKPVPYRGKQGFFYVPADDLTYLAGEELRGIGA